MSHTNEAAPSETLTAAELHARRCEADRFRAALAANLGGRDNAGARKAFGPGCDRWWRGTSDAQSLRAIVEAVARTIAFTAAGRSAVEDSLVVAEREGALAREKAAKGYDAEGNYVFDEATGARID